MTYKATRKKMIAEPRASTDHLVSICLVSPGAGVLRATHVDGTPSKTHRRITREQEGQENPLIGRTQHGARRIQEPEKIIAVRSSATGNAHKPIYGPREPLAQRLIRNEQAQRGEHEVVLDDQPAEDRDADVEPRGQGDEREGKEKPVDALRGCQCQCRSGRVKSWLGYQVQAYIEDALRQLSGVPRFAGHIGLPTPCRVDCDESPGSSLLWMLATDVYFVIS